MKRYEPKIIEPKWQAKWADNKTYEVTEDTSKQKVYATPMLPYPSGTGLHTGHVRNYSITDAVARYYRQKGFNTLSTIAWDAFGLPAENFAIKTGTPPAVSTAENIKYFKSQLQRLGMSYDWSREFNTSDPEYYKWTQWMFSLMYKKGLAYKAEKRQWWCNKCNTVLADEQVNSAGKCWRHEGPEDAEVAKKSVNQWFFKITDYADEILQATDALDWPEKIKTMQKNWIGKSEGALVRFDLKDGERIEVYTTRPDTLFGTTFIVLAPEHPMINRLIEQCENPQDVEKYVEKARRKSELEREIEKVKTGVALQGITVKNPINDKQIPVWVADYVLTSYGTGAVMGVPAHDERDNEFAHKYNIPIVEVIAPSFGTALPDAVDVTGPVVVGYDPKTKQYMSLINTKNNVNLRWFASGGLGEGETYLDAAYRELAEEAGFQKVSKMIQLGGPTYSYFYNSNKDSNRRSFSYLFLAIIDQKDQAEQQLEAHEMYEVSWTDADTILRDFMEAPEGRGHWIDGMKRAQDAVKALEMNEEYLAPISHDEGVLFNSGDFSGISTAEARQRIVQTLAGKDSAEPKTQYRIRDWLISRQRYWGAPVPIVYCEEHGEVLVPDDQLPVMLPEVANYVPDGKNSSILAGVEEWVNTICPECGKPAKRETDILDGYVCSTWYLHRYTDARNDQKAFDTSKSNYWFPIDFYFGGDHAVAHLLYIRFFQKVLCDAGLATEREPIKRLVYNGYINAEDGRKMSKSLGNTVDPMDIIESGYGADALRIFELFIAPYDQDTSWNSKGVPGTYRFINRLWTLAQEYLEKADDTSDTAGAEQVLTSAHKVIKKVSQDLDGLSFNTAVAAMMGAVNELYLIKAEHGYTARSEWLFALESMTQLIWPFAPHVAEELWHDLGHDDSVHISHWPEWDDKYLQTDTITYAVQVNGKLRGEVEVAIDADQDTVVATARANEKVAGYVTSDPKKVIFVKGKLVSFVV